MSTASPSNSSGSSSKQASAAAAIAAKIAAQFAAGGAGALGGGGLNDAAYTRDIDINDARNRCMLRKSSTQQEIQDETGASISTKGSWHPQRSKATERDPPLYLHIMAPTREIHDKAIKKVEELLAIGMGSLVEDKKDKMGRRRKWPEEKLPVGLERAKVVRPSGSFVKYIQQETGTRVQIKGVGSGSGPEESQVARAKVLTEDLLVVVRAEHAKMAAIVQAQQMELHQAQQQYAAHIGEAAYGYDVNSPEFKAWAAEQAKQAEQYYT
ncbi:hypothetical protein EV360DRAFT_97061 [Lentinula raphanica]|nr:hypothetical protein EV360DRAFT_97061 [Lentinula raphanica]